MPKTSTWKHAERQIARRLGTERIGPTGKAGPDAIAQYGAGWLLAEIKHRKTLPQWLKDALAQVTQHAGPNELAIAVLHESRMPYDDSLVVLRLSDFVEWFGDDGQ